MRNEHSSRAIQSIGQLEESICKTLGWQQFPEALIGLNLFIKFSHNTLRSNLEDESNWRKAFLKVPIAHKIASDWLAGPKSTNPPTVFYGLMALIR